MAKTIMVRDWTGSDLGRRAAWVNAAKRLSIFAMVLDLNEEDVVEMAQEFDDLQNTTAVTTTTEFKAIRARLNSKRPGDTEGFMVVLKRYTSLLHTLFSSQSPLYLQVFRIVQALRCYYPNARSKLSHEIKSCILWRILLQSRRFAQGKMVGETTYLDEFTNMVNLIKAKKCDTISHVEAPTELLAPSTTKRKGTVLGEMAAGGSEEKKNMMYPPPRRIQQSFNLAART